MDIEQQMQKMQLTYTISQRVKVLVKKLRRELCLELMHYQQDIMMHIIKKH